MDIASDIVAVPNGEIGWDIACLHFKVYVDILRPMCRFNGVMNFFRG